MRFHTINPKLIFWSISQNPLSGLVVTPTCLRVQMSKFGLLFEFPRYLHYLGIIFLWALLCVLQALRIVILIPTVN